MATKKAIWSVVGYTDSCPDLKKAIETIEGAGGKCMWITHDKDFYDHDDTKRGNFKKGDPEKIHYHIGCGWSKNAPDWARFVEILKAAKLCCPGKMGQHDPHTAHVEYPESLEDYFLHRDDLSMANPYKHRYDETELHFTEGWCLDDYTTYVSKRKAASDLRKAQRAEDASSCGFFFDLVRKHNLSEYCVLVDMVCSTAPDRLGDLLANSYPIKSYIDSRRSYTAVETAKSKKNAEYITRLHSQLEQEKRKNAQLRADLAAATEHEREVIERCRCVLENLGEPTPEWMEI